MKTGIIDTNGKIIELPIYEIKKLCDAIVNEGIEKIPNLINVYNEYKEKITRFYPSVEFCMHELGLILYNPYSKETEEVIYSYDNRCYKATLEYLKKFGKETNNKEIGYGRLFDNEIGYVKNPTAESIKTEGIVDEKGYVDASFAQDLETLAEVEVLYNIINSKEAYNEYMSNRDKYSSNLEYITSAPNIISAKKNNDESISLEYVSDNDGLVENFIESLQIEGKLSDMKLIVKNENTSLMKAA